MVITMSGFFLQMIPVENILRKLLNISDIIDLWEAGIVFTHPSFIIYLSGGTMDFHIRLLPSG